MERTEFGRFLVELRKKKRVSLKEMSKSMGVSSSFICAIERGRRSIPDHLLNKIASFFKMTLEDKANLRSMAFGDKQRIKFGNMSSDEKIIVFHFMKHLKGVDDGFKKEFAKSCSIGEASFVLP